MVLTVGNDEVLDRVEPPVLAEAVGIPAERNSVPARLDLVTDTIHHSIVEVVRRVETGRP